MNKKEIILSFIIFFSISFLFFYKIIVFGLVPFPGDLLIAEYNPWKTFSYLGYIPGTFPSKVQYFDTLRQIYPWQTLTLEVFKSGEFPLWNPYNFSGAPLFANGQSAVLYPLKVIYLFFSQTTSWSILVILQTLLSSFFTYLYTRKLGMEKLGAILSSIAFGFSLFVSVFLEYNTIGHVIVWLPLSLYFFERLRERINIFSVVFFTMCLVFAFLAGHIQIFGFILLFIIFYVFFRTLLLKEKIQKKVSSFFLYFGISLLSIGISGVQLLPTLELIFQSARVPQSYSFLIEKLLIQPYQTILLISPDFFGNPATRNYLIPDTYPGNSLYIGLIPFLLVIFAFYNFKKNYFIRYFSWSSVIIFFLILRTPFTEQFYKLNIPLFSTGSPTNAIFLLSFCLSILAGFGFEHLLKNKIWPRGPIIFFSLVLGIIWIFILLTKPDIVSLRNFLYSTIFFAVFAVSIILVPKYFKKNYIAYLLIGITIFDLFYFFHKFNPFVPKDLIFPPVSLFSFLKKEAGISRFWGYGPASFESNISSQFELFSPEGYDPLYPKIYGEFIYSSEDGKILRNFSNQTRSDAVIAKGSGEDLSLNKYRLRALDLLSVKYILDRQESGTTEKTFPIERFSKIYDKDGWKIFENKKALPRMLLVSDYKIFKTKEEFEKIFFSENFDPSKTILLEEKPVGLRDSFGNSSKLNLLSYSPNNISIKTNTDRASLLFLSDTFYPGWKAVIDKRDTKVYRADYAFRAVVVPKGSHTVEFIYKPESFRQGLIVSLGSLVTFIALLLVLKYKKIYA